MARVDDDPGLRIDPAPEADGSGQAEDAALGPPVDHDLGGEPLRHYCHSRSSRSSRPERAVATQSARLP